MGPSCRPAHAASWRKCTRGGCSARNARARGGGSGPRCPASATLRRPRHGMHAVTGPAMLPFQSSRRRMRETCRPPGVCVVRLFTVQLPVLPPSLALNALGRARQGMLKPKVCPSCSLLLYAGGQMSYPFLAFFPLDTLAGNAQRSYARQEMLRLEDGLRYGTIECVSPGTECSG